jgi:uncharacterized protein YcaQ
MPATLQIDKAKARRFLLAHLGLLPPRQLRGKPGALDFVRRVNCIQYDPINVVGQNPHLVLQSRVRGYRPEMLDELLYQERALIDGFDKQMAIYPTEDWPHFSYYRQQRAQIYREADSTAAAVELLEPVRGEIAARGPLSSLDLQDDTRMDWWLAGSVRAVRIALDILFYGGQTVVHHRVGTRRYFELSERVLPPEFFNTPPPHDTPDDYLEWHVYRRVGGLGLLHQKMTDKFGGTIGWRGGRIREAIQRLAGQGRLAPVAIAGLERQQFYVRPEDLPALEQAAAAPAVRPAAALIAPLDNLLWDRGLVELLFDFAYTWEVYVPAAKRRYGYYVLPVLYGDQFVARLDPAFERTSGVFTVQNWWWEAGVDEKDEALLAALAECLAEFGRYLGAVAIQAGEPLQGQAGLLEVIQSASRELGQ